MRVVFSILIVFASLTGMLPARAQAASDGEVAHWALAPFLGTGVYQIDDEQTIFVLAVTPRWVFKESPEEWDGKRKVGFQFVFPMALGFNRFDLNDIPGTVEPDNFETLSLVPGVYATIPMGKRWTLLGLANLGVGGRLDGGEYALTYRVGFRSRLRFGDERFRWSLINALEYAGYNTDSNLSSQVAPLMLAFEFDNRLGNVRLDGKPAHLVSHIMYTHFIDEFTFDLPSQRETSVNDDFEIGLAIRRQTKFRLWRLNWDRIGIAYRRGNTTGSEQGNVFRGIRIYFRSVFEQ